jgi:hypothetical protein
MNIYEKLLAIQQELKAPKSQYNKFGNYNYRNCEDILEAVKPINQKHKAVLVITDRIFETQGRFYVEANAILTDIEKPEDRIIVQAFARESEEKKGMDSSQVTGATSSYARKYALNGLYNIDDNKDADSMDNGDEGKKTSVRTPKVTTPQKPVRQEGKITAEQVIVLKGLLTPERTPKLLGYYNIEKLEDLPSAKYAEALNTLSPKEGK